LGHLQYKAEVNDEQDSKSYISQYIIFHLLKFIYNTSEFNKICRGVENRLSSTKNPKYDDVIKKAQKYIEGIQLDEGEGVTTDDKFYGGIGYGSDPSTRDLSNLSFALQGLKESGLSAESEVWDKAIKFLERCQNNSETNDQSSTALVGNDGGFIYYLGNSKAGNDEEGIPRSYSGMTYAGLLSFIYANVDKEDTRVQVAMKWIQNHYTVDENYGMDMQGL